MAIALSHGVRSANPYVDSLVGETRWFYESGDIDLTTPIGITIGFDDSGSGGAWPTTLREDFMTALDSIEAVTNISFLEVPADENPVLLQRLEVSDELVNDGALAEHGYPRGTQAIGNYNVDDPGWTSGATAPGGYLHETILHEVLHGLGLTHPHDTGEGSGIWPGVEAGSTGVGSEGTNHARNTVMSYNQAPGAGALIGNSIGPMAYDIAALQAIYGINTTHNANDNRYDLADVAGTGWLSIWDAAGSDTIVFDGPEDATINLQAATLVGPNGGGELSFISGVAGGYTIANGAAIEHASGGGGDDTLTGNALNNTLSGNDGNDLLVGLWGQDVLWGGAGADTVSGGDGRDTIMIDAEDAALEDDYVWLNGGRHRDKVIITDDSGLELRLAHTDVEVIIGSGGNDKIIGEGVDYSLVIKAGDGINELTGGRGGDRLVGGRDEDRFYASSGNDRVEGGHGTDIYMAEHITTNVTIDLARGVATGEDIDRDVLNSIEAAWGGSGSDTIVGSSGDNFLFGDDGNDDISGGGGVDFIEGGTGFDLMTGGANGDIFVFHNQSGLTSEQDFTTDGDWDGRETRPVGVEDLSEASGYDFAAIANALGNAFPGSNSSTGGSPATGGGQQTGAIDILFPPTGTIGGGDSSDLFEFGPEMMMDVITDWQDGTDVLDFNAVNQKGQSVDFDDLNVLDFGKDAYAFADGIRIAVVDAAGQINESDFLFA